MRRNRRKVGNKLSILRMRYLSPRRLLSFALPVALMILVIPIITAISISTTYQSRVFEDLGDLTEQEFRPQIVLLFLANNHASDVDFISSLEHELEENSIGKIDQIFGIGEDIDVAGAEDVEGSEYKFVENELEACDYIKSEMQGRDVLVISDSETIGRALYLCNSAGLRSYGYVVSHAPEDIASSYGKVLGMVDAIGLVLSNSLK